MKSTVCIAEDRRNCEPAVRLLLASLSSNCPAVDVNLFYPLADSAFLTWVEKCSQARVETAGLPSGCGWNVKPLALLRLLDEGFDEVTWIDSDVIVTRDFSREFRSLESDVFLAAEDAVGDDRDDGDAMRAHLWGLPVGRTLPFGLNSGVLRVTRYHRPLLYRWWELLQTREYKEVQRRPWRQRPVHMLGDQDVLTALLTSAEFSEIPLHILRRGRDIIQFNGVYGYSTWERIYNLVTGPPAFIHSFAGKPWLETWESGGGAREYLKNVYLDASPYTFSAMRFRRELGCDAQWMNAHYAFSRLLRALGLGRPELVGLPIAAVMDVVRMLKRKERAVASTMTHTDSPSRVS